MYKRTLPSAALDQDTATWSLTGDATLSYRTSTGHRLLMIGQLLTWVFAAMALLRVSGRAREVRS